MPIKLILKSISSQYICLACLPRKILFTGYDPLRQHLRSVHSFNKIFSVEDSNRHRADGGYILDGTHYYPGEAGFEAWRAIGYGVKRVPPPAPNAESTHGINLTAEQSSAMVTNIMNQMTQNVATGVNNTIQGAASMLNMMSGNQAEQEINTRRYFPVPHSNNILVAINNPNAKPALEQGESFMYRQFHSA